MGKHAKIEPAQKVASVFVPISRSGLSKQLRGKEWRKDLLMSWLFQRCIRLQTSLDRRFLRFGMTVQEASVLLRCVEAIIDAGIGLPSHACQVMEWGFDGVLVEHRRFPFARPNSNGACFCQRRQRRPQRFFWLGQ